MIELVELRQELENLGNWSHTSLKYQDDVLNIVTDSIDQGDYCIEVGCYKGGLTAQLAYLAKLHNKTLFVIDIDPQMISETSSLLKRFNLNERVRFFVGTLQDFIDQGIGSNTPSCIVVDGDHRYDGVLADLKAIESMKNKPISLAFHDYSLRYIEGSGLTDVLVSKAIHDRWGAGLKVTLIGEIPRQGGVLNLKDNPGPHGHYFEENGSEGVLVLWSDVRK